MYFEEYGDKNSTAIVMLHGMNFVHAFGRQYALADRYHIIVPHITGYGKEAENVFTTRKAVEDIVEVIRNQNKKVVLIGFSLGAQIAFRIANEVPELLLGAILVSPWLIKDKESVQYVTKMNEKPFRMLQKRWFCKIVEMMNGLPKKQRNEFVEYMQKVQLETIRNSVDNGITLETTPEFGKNSVPILAIAGAKEQDVMKQSVIGLAANNPNCKYEIWEKAAHNIPTVFAKRFNEKIVEFVDSVS